MISRRLKIIRKKWYTDNIVGLEFKYPGLNPLPGQFFQIQVDEGLDPFLNRPISIASYSHGRLLMVVKVAGRGTQMLSTKEKGDQVTGATVNLTGLLTISAQRLGQDSTLAQIIRLVESAQSSKAPIQQLADRISLIFVPIVVAIGSVAFLGWWLSGAGISAAILRFTAVLIISCPCAMGLATPLAIMVGIGRAAEKGILFKSGEALQLQTAPDKPGEPILDEVDDQIEDITT